MMISHWSKLLIMHACWCFSSNTRNAMEIHWQNGQSYFWLNPLGGESFICSTLIKHMGSSNRKKLKLLSIKEKDRFTTNLAWAKLKAPSLLASSLCSVSLRWIVFTLSAYQRCDQGLVLRTSGQGQTMTVPRDDSIIPWAKQICQLSKHSEAQQILSLRIAG